MVGKAERSNDRAQVSELLEEGLWFCNRSNRREISSSYHVKRKRLTSRSASQIAWREMRDGDWHVQRDVGECTLHIGDGGLFRDLSCDDRESGQASGAKSCAPWPSATESRSSCPGVCVNQQTICVALSSATP